MKDRLTALLLTAGVAATHLHAQSTWRRLSDGLALDVELNGQLSSGDYAPLWLSGNRYGLSSVEANAAYERLTLSRPIEEDSLREWRIGYALDLALQQNAVTTFTIQQAYVEATWKKLRLTVGAKEQPMDLKNQTLSSGGLSMGINAKPIPQVRGEADYFSIPFTNGWWKWKGRLSYGRLTDDNWVEDVTTGTNEYATGTLYHEKALYWKFGREDRFPLTYEIGIQMAAEFGGTTYNATGRGYSEATTIKHSTGLSAFVDVLLARGSDETDGYEANTAGNHVGSYNMALTWNAKQWMARAYFERYFEDQSMLTLQYGIQDHLIGVEWQLKRGITPLRAVVIEHLSTRNQSGAVYHDATTTLPEKMNGRDNYYNHGLYNGWQHWGQTLGHPFLTSPIYTVDEYGQVYFYNNRVKAWHFAFDGQPTAALYYRVKLSFTENWGTYNIPYAEKANQQYLLAECRYAPTSLGGLRIGLSLAYDHGDVLGDSFGAQLTLAKRFAL